MVNITHKHFWIKNVLNMMVCNMTLVQDKSQNIAYFLIVADVMASLNIPKGVRRVLFRTLNTDRYVLHFYLHIYDTVQRTCIGICMQTHQFLHFPYRWIQRIG